MGEIERGGGAAAAIARGDFQEAIHRSAYAHQQAVEAGERVIVGVNRYTDESPPLAMAAPDYSTLAARQVERIRAVRAARDGRAWQAALDALAAAARGSEPLMSPILAAVRARATVGEISDTLRNVWGVFRPRV
jgi:methylmalonyl-CoA mutase N-terminal domain/subunit